MRNKKKWLIYSQPGIATENYVARDHGLVEYKGYCLNEKLKWLVKWQLLVTQVILLSYLR